MREIASYVAKSLKPIIQARNIVLTDADMLQAKQIVWLKRNVKFVAKSLWQARNKAIVLTNAEQSEFKIAHNTKDSCVGPVKRQRDIVVGVQF